MAFFKNQGGWVISFPKIFRIYRSGNMWYMGMINGEPHTTADLKDAMRFGSRKIAGREARFIERHAAKSVGGPVILSWDDACVLQMERDLLNEPPE